MTGRELSCPEILGFFEDHSRSEASDRPLTEGVQDALLNLWTRLSAHCPSGSCDRSPECVLFDQADAGAKEFDDEQGKVAFLRSKVRREGTRAPSHWKHAPPTDLVGTGGRSAATSKPPVDRTTQRAATLLRLESDLAGVLADVRTALGAVDVRAFPFGLTNAVAAVSIAHALVDEAEFEGLPVDQEGLRQLFRRLTIEVLPLAEQGTDAAVRQRRKRLRSLVRLAFEHAGFGELGDVFAPPEPTKARKVTPS